MSQPREYPFGKEFQTKLLALFVRRPQQVDGIVEPHYFSNPIHAEIARLVFEVRERNPNLRRVARRDLYEVVRSHLGRKRSEERRVGKECRARWSTYD